MYSYRYIDTFVHILLRGTPGKLNIEYFVRKKDSDFLLKIFKKRQILKD